MLGNFLIFAAVVIVCQLNPCNVALADNVSHVSEIQTTSIQDASKPSTLQDASNSSTVEDTLNPPQANADSVSNVPLDKTWVIQFNEPIDISSAKSSVKIIDTKTNEEVPINISLTQNNFYINISSISPYNPDSYYLLSVDNSLTSTYNRHLKTSFSMTFKTESIITSISDINATINQGDSYTLPDEVTANMSDGEKKSVSITWDKPLDNLDVPGNYVYQGEVEGYDKKVNLNLAINASDKNTSSNANSSSPSGASSSTSDASSSSSSSASSSSSSSVNSTTMWIWELQDEVDKYGGIDNLISKLKSLGVTNVCIKYHEGSSPTGGGIDFRADFLKYVNNFKEAGFEVGTWGYNYFNYVQDEANLIIDALNNSDYYIFDPEDDVAGKTEQAEEVCELVRSKCPNAVIGYASFPVESYHQDIPYSVFNKYCDFAAPQCYWGDMQWSVTACIDKMLQDYKDDGLDKPIYPLIQTYNVNYNDYVSYLGYKFKSTGLWSLDDLDSTCEDFLTNRGNELSN
ncbi:Ig-like domain-containing protein [Clostridium sp. WILCCON 0269]|uniref:Ig-like domain-containing protein n=1 Tax=Candidatus Clostridium eludens TaxID=3381663 RepID=A0ABW8SRD4_9CLOT